MAGKKNIYIYGPYIFLSHWPLTKSIILKSKVQRNFT